MTYDDWKTTEPDPHANCASRCLTCGACTCEPPCQCVEEPAVWFPGTVGTQFAGRRLMPDAQQDAQRRNRGLGTSLLNAVHETGPTAEVL